MSSAVSIIKEAGPYVVALAGMAAAYFGTRRTGRETRHHARVESLYTDMLDDLFRRRHMIVEALRSETPDRIPGLSIGLGRVYLYASPMVREAWDHAVQVQDAVALLEHPEDLSRELLAAYDDAETELLHLMRSDLRVPVMSVRDLLTSNALEVKRQRRFREKLRLRVLWTPPRDGEKA